MRLLGGELFQRAIRSEGFVEFARHLGGECAVPFEYLGRGRPQPRRSRPGRRLIVQPDATITAPDSKVLLEAKGMRTSSFVHCRRSESPRADAERLLQGVHPGAFARSESYVSRNTISASSISVAIRLEPAHRFRRGVSGSVAFAACLAEPERGQCLIPAPRGGGENLNQPTLSVTQRRH
jgi:hypothetical protein